MTSLRHQFGRAVCVAATALALICTATPNASARPLPGRDVPETADIDRGTTAEVPWTYQNSGGLSAPPSGSTVVFQAPGNTTFTEQTTVNTSYSTNGQNWGATNLGLRNCQRSNNDRTLTCEAYGKNGQRTTWGTGGYFQFRPEVTVDYDAPFGKTPAGSGEFSFTSITGIPFTAEATLNVNVPVPVMCLVAPKDADQHDPVRIWKCADIDSARFSSDWQYVGKELQSTDGTGYANCVYNWPTQANEVQMWQCGETYDDRTHWTRQGLTFIHDRSGMCLDAGSGRRNGDIVLLQPCTAGNTAQDWTWSGSKLVVS
ncbi:ricin-type beta-trefoil lectin domain protein [Kitasatospora sp. NPDC058046]|uniref:ricin-type beta-trefoil lectin domain protein n=1 Tax=Kitasatospora sp. NPDC058046 TaxID=3346312 RepID=UPI0036D8F40F